MPALLLNTPIFMLLRHTVHLSFHAEVPTLIFLPSMGWVLCLFAWSDGVHHAWYTG